MLEFHKSFFEKEIRCDFEIPELMKRAWAAQMEVLDIVVSICNEHHLPYFADSGTLLGAVRHHGFIPWDDDIDISLMREDYNRLVEILKVELPVGYEIAGMFAEDKRLQRAEYAQQLRVIAEARNWDYAEYLKTFHGYPFEEAGIDIFPLDYMPRDPELFSVQRALISAGVGVLSNWNQLIVSGDLEYYLRQLEELWGVTIPRDDTTNHFCWTMVDHISSMFHEEEADEVTNFIYFSTENYHARKEWFAERIIMPFENMTIAVPIGYDQCLTNQYGDYGKFQKFTSTHTYPYYKNQDIRLFEKLKKRGFTGTLEEFCVQGANGDIAIDITGLWNE